MIVSASSGLFVQVFEESWHGRRKAQKKGVKSAFQVCLFASFRKKSSVHHDAIFITVFYVRKEEG